MNSQKILNELKQKTEEALHRKSVFNGPNKDVSELVKLIDALSKQQIELEQKIKVLEEKESKYIDTEKQLLEKLQAKDTFLSLLAHDLKTPFHTMLGYSYLLLKEYPKYNTKKRVSIIQILYESIQQTHKLLENILVWSRAQTGKIQYNPRNINVTTLIKENIRLFEATAKAKDVSLTYISVLDDLMTWADPEIIQLVLRNLISNAIKFTPKGGQVSAGIHDYSDGKVIVCVCDNGVGIPKHVQDKLFHVDEKISTPGTNDEHGTGLGLILCKEFIGKSGGELWFSSKEGEGSTFYFSLQNKS